MQLAELITQIKGFDRQSPRERIRIFAWFLHTQTNREFFDSGAIRACFADLHLAEPNVAQYLSRMVAYKELMKSKSGFKLERSARLELDKKYGVHHSVIAVSKILTELPAKVPNISERSFLQEALKCYRVEAYRSCIVMTWNLAYAHLLDWILRDSNRLASFNGTIAKRFPGLKNLQITKYDEFLDELKERQVIEICSSAGLLNSNIFKILREKLDRRNIVAHPSTVTVVQSQADDVVTDLINNVVLILL